MVAEMMVPTSNETEVSRLVDGVWLKEYTHVLVASHLSCS